VTWKYFNLVFIEVIGDREKFDLFVEIVEPKPGGFQFKKLKIL